MVIKSQIIIMCLACVYEGWGRDEKHDELEFNLIA